MNAPAYILAIDQGTTSTKAVVLDRAGRVAGTSDGARHAVTATHPRAGWVEHDPEQILATVIASARAAVGDAGLDFADIAAVGLANHGETVVAFDRADGTPVYPAISWQDRRGEDLTDAWRASGLEPLVVERTGLRLDPYFSAAKMAWIMRHVAPARDLSARGRLALGTLDSWLLWRLTGGRAFITDVATASRTMLLDLATLRWSDALLDALALPAGALAELRPNAGIAGHTDAAVFGAAVPIAGLCVDQQAALFGHGCLRAGEAKATYGTGCFVLANIGADAGRRAEGLLTCVGWQLEGAVSYALDGGVYSAGSVAEWLVDLGLVTSADALSDLAASVGSAGGVLMVPAFSGLAAPHWQGRARACWAGMSQGTERGHLVRAALESIAYRVNDIAGAMAAAGIALDHLRVDGGLTRCAFLMQHQADVLGVPVTCSATPELTARGVGLMAGLGCGLWPSVATLPASPAPGTAYVPDRAASGQAQAQYRRWQRVCSDIARWGELDLV